MEVAVPVLEMLWIVSALAARARQCWTEGIVMDIGTNGGA